MRMKTQEKMLSGSMMSCRTAWTIMTQRLQNGRFKGTNPAVSILSII